MDGKALAKDDTGISDDFKSTSGFNLVGLEIEAGRPGWIRFAGVS
jgi:hypothetical protein